MKKSVMEKDLVMLSTEYDAGGNDLLMNLPTIDQTQVLYGSLIRLKFCFMLLSGAL